MRLTARVELAQSVIDRLKYNKISYNPEIKTINLFKFDDPKDCHLIIEDIKKLNIVVGTADSTCRESNFHYYMDVYEWARKFFTSYSITNGQGKSVYFSTVLKYTFTVEASFIQPDNRLKGLLDFVNNNSSHYQVMIEPNKLSIIHTYLEYPDMGKIRWLGLTFLSLVSSLMRDRIFSDVDNETIPVYEYNEKSKQLKLKNHADVIMGALNRRESGVAAYYITSDWNSLSLRNPNINNFWNGVETYYQIPMDHTDIYKLVKYCEDNHISFEDAFPSVRMYTSYTTLIPVMSKFIYTWVSLSEEDKAKVSILSNKQKIEGIRLDNLVSNITYSPSCYVHYLEDEDDEDYEDDDEEYWDED